MRPKKNQLKISFAIAEEEVKKEKQSTTEGKKQ